ncbi:RNA polymerase sigma factor [Asanoa ishikariensis]|uniref:RNA polymerase sigma factor n=1 Tax=Asanoa ishikariensis TaxID=137265 RepID=A0A1H3S5E1_9ACTN|nr:RNA polymerase subunit sigma-70 [Asanoa ishikariensis]GIF66470.1 RNA polymerase sigma factor [Asanoa ishikariensis]SDZ33104.1 RNA polymerase, sigma subunit, ECF family [Asanoa ishikariensis]
MTLSVEAHRSELLAHCYRMLGSVDDAEDVVQETMLRAWRARDSYDPGRASPRTWLYRIATNACLTALAGRARRPLPSGLGAPPSDDPDAPLTPSFEIPWLQPFPDARLADDPAGVVIRRRSLRLALVAALQLLPPRQRAVLLLREVLEFSAAEVADLLDTSVPAVNSALQRARAALSEVGESSVAEPDDSTVRDTVDRYVRAFEIADVDGLVRLLTADAVLEMPPVPLWYRGRDAYGAFLRRVFAMRGDFWRVVRLEANTQPAFAAYVRTEAGFALHTLQVLTVTPAGPISRNVVFQDPAVFADFALPPTLAA